MIVFIISVITEKDEDNIVTKTDIFGLITSVFVLIIGIIIYIVSMTLLKLIMLTAKNAKTNFNKLVVFKLKYGAIVLFVSFTSYSLITIISSISYTKTFYVDNAYWLDGIVKIADFVSLLTIYIIYAFNERMLLRSRDASTSGSSKLFFRARFASMIASNNRIARRTNNSGSTSRRKSKNTAISTKRIVLKTI